MFNQRHLNRVLVFLPSFGDRAVLPELIHSISNLGDRYQSLVIDDGSEKPLLIQLDRVLTVRFPANFGLGVCTNLAFDHAIRHGYSAVVRVDSDGQHEVNDIPRLMEEIDSGRANIVVGVRTNHADYAQSLGLGRRMLKFYFKFLSQLLTGGKAPADVNSGFFALDIKAVRKLNNQFLERFPEPEIFVSACRAGLSLSSVLVKQKERAYGDTTLSVISAMRMFFRFNIFALNELFRRRRQ